MAEPTTRRGSTSSEEDYDEPVWDEDSLKKIELIEANHFGRTTPRNHITVQLELELEQPPLQSFASLIPNPSNSSSLYSRFRLHRHFLSVSDLVSCKWCQFQVEYGLLGKRYLRPSQRPKSFISSSGVEIKVNPKLVVSRQKILDGGKKVHAKLEKEVAPEAVKVQVITQVDTWGLKMLNTIINLCLLRATGMMREIHVWGFIGGFLIQGIIDQIDLLPDSSTVHPTPQSPSKDNGESLPGALSHENDQRSGTPPPHPAPSRSRFLARISDSKTIQTSTLPPPEHTESPRYQLMLYKYLHDQNARGEFDVKRFGAHLGIDLDERFSAPFLQDMGPVIGATRADFEDDGERFSSPATLGEMFRLYERVIRMVGVSDETLEIVYRHRGGRRNRSGGGTDPKKLKLSHEQPAVNAKSLPTPAPAHSLSNQLDSSAAQIGIFDSNLPVNPAPQQQESFPEPKQLGKLTNGSEEGKNGRSSSEDRATHPTTELEAVDDRHEKTAEKKVDPEPLSRDFGRFSTAERMRARLDKRDEGIVGAYEFEFHPLEFASFVRDALWFWNGDKPPVGVDITDFKKCDYCEFKDGCEWRTKLSNEIFDAL